MTIYQNRVINPERPWSFMDDTKENILEDLEQYTLDPVFEKYGNFVYQPTWDEKENEEKYKGMTVIFGNFLEVSHAFRVLTDDEKLITELEESIRKNQESEKYKEAKERIQKINAELKPYGKELVHGW